MKKILCLLVMLTAFGSFAQDLDKKLLQAVAQHKKIWIQWREEMGKKGEREYTDQEIRKHGDEVAEEEDKFDMLLEQLDAEARKGKEAAYHELFDLVDYTDGCFGEALESVFRGLAKDQSKAFKTFLKKEKKSIQETVTLFFLNKD